MPIPTQAQPWTFHGRHTELAALQAVLGRGRFFLLRMAGRRRIGKTTLVLEAMRRSGRARVAYVQCADADAAGVVAGARAHLQLSGVPDAAPTSLNGLAATIGSLLREGWVVVLDEFQVFARQALSAFPSALQFEVDRLLDPTASPTTGGLVLLGSVMTEMEALLDGRRAPLYGRCTDVLSLDHLRATECAAILDRYGAMGGQQLLFWWTLLQGIPKYWRDAFEVGALPLQRQSAVAALFFEGTAPLSAEGQGWLADELRGRYDVLLRYLARNPGSSRADITAHLASVAGPTSHQVGPWLVALEERFRLVQRREPVHGESKGRDGRYAITDNFLLAWLGALADPVALSGVRPLPELLAEADRRLATLEGFAFERLVAELYHQRSAAGRGFAVTARVGRWWDRTGADLDLVAIDAQSHTLRVGSSKRSADKLPGDCGAFEAALSRLLARHPQWASWKLERVALAPEIDADRRAALVRNGWIVEDVPQLLGEAAAT